MLAALVCAQLTQCWVQGDTVKYNSLVHVQRVLILSGACGADIHRAQLQALVCSMDRGERRRTRQERRAVLDLLLARRQVMQLAAAYNCERMLLLTVVAW